MMHADARGFHDRAQRLDQVAVDLEGVDRGAGLGQGQSQGPSPAPISKTWSPGPMCGQARDAPHGIGVHHEVLAQRARRGKPVRFHQRDEFSSSVGHQETLTLITPLASGSSSANCVSLRSTT